MARNPSSLLFQAIKKIERKTNQDVNLWFPYRSLSALCVHGVQAIQGPGRLEGLLWGHGRLYEWMGCSRRTFRETCPTPRRRRALVIVSLARNDRNAPCTRLSPTPSSLLVSLFVYHLFTTGSLVCVLHAVSVCAIRTLWDSSVSRQCQSGSCAVLCCAIAA